MDPLMTVDEVALERRLTQMEGTITSGFTGVHERLDRLNGQVGRNTSWRIDHAQDHAVEDGIDGAQETNSKAFWARMTALFAMAGALSGIVFSLIEALR